jgi:hypothetical protein
MLLQKVSSWKMRCFLLVVGGVIHGNTWDGFQSILIVQDINQVVLNDFSSFLLNRETSWCAYASPLVYVLSERGPGAGNPGS